MPIPIIFILFIIFTLVFTLKVRKVDKEKASLKKSFWEREEKALFVRKKSLDDLDYVHITEEDLPIMDYNAHPDIMEIQKKVSVLLPQKMVSFAGKTNTDLKLSYGTANFDTLSLYEERYTRLLRLLYEWGKLLNEAGKIQEAIQVLEVGVHIHTDISKHYILLGSLYKSQHDQDHFQRIYDFVLASDFMLKNKIIEAMDRM